MAEKKIGGRVFRVQKCSAGEAIELCAELTGFLGPAAGQLPYLLFGMQDGGAEGDIVKDAALLSALGQVVNVKGAKAVRGLAERVVGHAQVQGPSGAYHDVDLDGDLSNDVKEVMPIAAFVLKEVIGPFFSGSGGNGLFAKIATACRERT